MTNNIDVVLMRYMYEIDREGGSKNRSLGIYLGFKIHSIPFCVFIAIQDILLNLIRLIFY